jgi:uncharacterized membrane protein required for colicin V production
MMLGNWKVNQWYVSFFLVALLALDFPVSLLAELIVSEDLGRYVRIIGAIVFFVVLTLPFREEGHEPEKDTWGW